MSKVPFGNLPFIVQFATMLSLFTAWVCFEEFVIDRHGLDEFLPYYRVGNFCPYDVAVIVLLGALWIALSRRKT
jgi:hypothetical protein